MFRFGTLSDRERRRIPAHVDISGESLRRCILELLTEKVSMVMRDLYSFVTEYIASVCLFHCYSF